MFWWQTFLTVKHMGLVLVTPLNGLRRNKYFGIQIYNTRDSCNLSIIQARNLFCCKWWLNTVVSALFLLQVVTKQVFNDINILNTPLTNMIIIPSLIFIWNDVSETGLCLRCRVKSLLIWVQSREVSPCLLRTKTECSLRNVVSHKVRKFIMYKKLYTISINNKRLLYRHYKYLCLGSENILND
jgi:hypothetical protein